MSVWDQIWLRSTYRLVTRPHTPCWTRAGARQAQRSSLHTRVHQMLHSTVERRPPALPGPHRPPPLPPTVPWDYMSRSSNTLHVFPSQWRQRLLMMRCWESRDSPYLSCHVTLTNTQTGTMMKTPSNSQPTTSPKTINLVYSAELSAVSWLFKLTLSKQLGTKQ